MSATFSGAVVRVLSGIEIAAYRQCQREYHRPASKDSPLDERRQEGQPLPPKYTAFGYIVEGEGLFGAESEGAGDGQMVLIAQDGDDVRIENSTDSKATLEVLLIAGIPLNEPVARYGPFVMNTEGEIRLAIEDYQRGRMGAINS